MGSKNHKTDADSDVTFFFLSGVQARMHCALSGRERSRGETEAARNQLDLQLLHLSRDCVPPNIGAVVR